jgi:hypothetical protein
VEIDRVMLPNSVVARHAFTSLMSHVTQMCRIFNVEDIGVLLETLANPGFSPVTAAVPCTSKKIWAMVRCGLVPDLSGPRGRFVDIRRSGDNNIIYF